MSWNEDELRALGDSDEVAVSSRRADGTLRPYITIWGVRVGNDFYIRSAYGAGNGWFRRAVASRAGSIRGRGQSIDVDFELLDPTDPARAEVDSAYHSKYDRYGARIVNTVVGPVAAEVTLRLSPAN
jgi:hypothetical protein